MTFRRDVFVGIIAGSLAFSSQSASAAWFFQSNESAFDDDNTVQAALTVGAYGGFGVRCQGADLKVVYMLSETGFDADTVEKSNSLRAFKLKLRVDKNAVVEMEATASLPQSGMLAFISSVSTTQVEQIRDAKKQVAIAVSILGQNYYEDKLSASGSTAIIQKVLEGCAGANDKS